MNLSNKYILLLYIFLLLIISYTVPIWYIFIIVLILLSLIFSKKDTPAFFFGFISVFIVWTFIMIFIDKQNNSILSEKITVLFKLPSKWLLILITAVIGSLLGGLSSLLGKYIKSSFGYIK